MKELIDRIPQIITASAASARGVISLMVIAFSILAYVFLRESGDGWKFASLALLFAGGIGFGFAVYGRSADAMSDASDMGKSANTQPDVINDSPIDVLLDRWISEAEIARAAKTVVEDSSFPTHLIESRHAFEIAWRQSSLPERKLLDPVKVIKGIGYLTRLYRLEEESSPVQAKAKEWADEAIRFSEEIQNPTLLTEALLEKAAICLDLAHLEHTEKSNFERIVRDGDSLVTRAYQTASLDQRTEVLRIASRFYYCLARPQNFRLSDNWDNNYLLLAYEKILEANDINPSSLKNANQLARVVIKVSKNPPQDREEKWTKRLRSTKNLLKHSWELNKGERRTISERLSPLNVLGVITLETVAREWGDALESERLSLAHELLDEIDSDSLGPLREAMALLENSELRSSYGFDIQYDVARSLAVKTAIFGVISTASADTIFSELKDNLEFAREAARTSQIESALRDINREITFSFLSLEQKSTITRLISISETS